MTASRKCNSSYLSEDEWKELQMLREAISYSPASICPKLQEKFVDLFTRSLIGKKSDTPNATS